MNIHEFFQATIDALVRWYKIHYDRDYWIDHWVGAKDIEKYFQSCKGHLSNAYFHFNWREAAYHRFAMVHNVSGWSVEKSEEFYSKHDVGLEPKYLWDSLYEEGFDKFCEETHPHTDKFKDEVLEHLQAVSDAGNSEDQMYAVMWALKIQHTNGYIADDYSDGQLNKTMINMVRGSGIEMVFGRAEVEKFLRGEYPRLVVEGLHANLEADLEAGTEGAQSPAA